MISIPQHRLIEFGQKLTRNSNGCLEWCGEKSQSGYGRFRFEADGKIHRWMAHRLVYSVYKGEIPDDLVVMHLCDNPKCCAIEHLALGTPKENMQDASRKNRLGLNSAFGPMVCRDMFLAHESGESQVSIAQRYNATQAGVWYCIKKRYPKYLSAGFYEV